VDEGRGDRIAQPGGQTAGGADRHLTAAGYPVGNGHPAAAERLGHQRGHRRPGRLVASGLQHQLAHAGEVGVEARALQRLPRTARFRYVADRGGEQPTADRAERDLDREDLPVAAHRARWAMCAARTLGGNRFSTRRPGRVPGE
jgi:hypothetical protein